MGQIRSFIADKLATAIEDACSCGFNASHLQLPDLECDPTQNTHPTYRALVYANSQYSVEDIVIHVENWVASEPTITVGLVVVSVDSSCPVSPSLNDDFCTSSGDGTYSASVLIGTIIAEFVVLVVIFALVCAAFLIVSSNIRSKKR